MRLIVVCIDKLYQKLRKQYARIERLRKQKKSLKKRSNEMLRREIQSLDKLNTLKNPIDSNPNQEIIVASSIDDLFYKLFFDF